MRSAVEQMANNQYSQQFAGHPGLAYQQPRQNMFNSTTLQQQQQQQQISPRASTPGSSYRQVPYPSPNHPGYRHGRAYSTAVIPTNKVQTPSTPAPSSLDHRRMSTPATIPPQLDTTGTVDPDYVQQTQSAQFNQTYNPFWSENSPFTTSLPPESQQMLAGSQALDPNDPFTASLMNGSEQYLSNPYYPWGNDMHPGMKAAHAPASYQNMSVTLAPAAVTSQPESLAATPISSSTTLDGNLSSSYDPLGLNHIGMYQAQSPHSLHSGQNTPGESFWSNFVQDDSWESVPQASQ